MRGYLLGAGLNGALGVAMGAWAAHGLRAALPEAALGWIDTGASYQLWHAAALLGLAAIAHVRPSRWFSLAGWGFGLGALLFAATLYLHALAGAGWVGALAPVGGLLMIGGWIFTIVAALGMLPGR